MELKEWFGKGIDRLVGRLDRIEEGLAEHPPTSYIVEQIEDRLKSRSKEVRALRDELRAAVEICEASDLFQRALFLTVGIGTKPPKQANLLQVQQLRVSGGIQTTLDFWRGVDGLYATPSTGAYNMQFGSMPTSGMNSSGSSNGTEIDLPEDEYLVVFAIIPRTRKGSE